MSEAKEAKTQGENRKVKIQIKDVSFDYVDQKKFFLYDFQEELLTC